MDQEKMALLSQIIAEHIHSAKPVASQLIVDKYGLKMSSATIRNRMAELEEEGYLTHPYTSGGRIPTIKGYDFYIKNLLEIKKISSKEKQVLEKIKTDFQDQREILKNLAKGLAEFSQGLVFIAFKPLDFYYTGVANLFSQVEFREYNLVCNLSEVIDHFDEVLENIFDQVTEQPQILIGNQNPFGEACGTIITKYNFNCNDSLLGILGPMRMDYGKNLGLIKYIQELIK
ncbi:MAG: hypothetical protein PHS07_01765 [Patescibacteria group bacterium]|nr:hypothetical protein [Patescibacteria group bacterium]